MTLETLYSRDTPGIGILQIKEDENIGYIVWYKPTQSECQIDTFCSNVRYKMESETISKKALEIFKIGSEYHQFHVNNQNEASHVRQKNFTAAHPNLVKQVCEIKKNFPQDFAEGKDLVELLETDATIKSEIKGLASFKNTVAPKTMSLVGTAPEYLYTCNENNFFSKKNTSLFADIKYGTDYQISRGRLRELERHVNDSL